MPALGAAHPSAELVVASRGISKGLVQTSGPQFTAKGQVSFGVLQLVTQYKNITSPAARGQASATIGFASKVGALQLSGKATYKFRTGLKPGAVDTEALELNLGASHRRGPFEGRISYSYSPDDLGVTRRSGYVEAVALVDISRSTSVSGTIGRRNRELSPDYTAFSLGVTRSVSRSISADLRFYGTDRKALGPAYAPHVVLSLRGNWK